MPTRETRQERRRRIQNESRQNNQKVVSLSDHKLPTAVAGEDCFGCDGCDNVSVITFLIYRRSKPLPKKGSGGKLAAANRENTYCYKCAVKAKEQAEKAGTENPMWYDGPAPKISAKVRQKWKDEEQDIEWSTDEEFYGESNANVKAWKPEAKRFLKTTTAATASTSSSASASSVKKNSTADEKKESNQVELKKEKNKVPATAVTTTEGGEKAVASSGKGEEDNKKKKKKDTQQQHNEDEAENKSSVKTKENKEQKVDADKKTTKKTADTDDSDEKKAEKKPLPKNSKEAKNQTAAVGTRPITSFFPSSAKSTSVSTTASVSGAGQKKVPAEKQTEVGTSNVPQSIEKEKKGANEKKCDDADARADNNKVDTVSKTNQTNQKKNPTPTKQKVKEDEAQDGKGNGKEIEKENQGSVNEKKKGDHDDHRNKRTGGTLRGSNNDDDDSDDDLPLLGSKSNSNRKNSPTTTNQTHNKDGTVVEKTSTNIDFDDDDDIPLMIGKKVSAVSVAMAIKQEKDDVGNDADDHDDDELLIPSAAAAAAGSPKTSSPAGINQQGSNNKRNRESAAMEDADTTDSQDKTRQEDKQESKTDSSKSNNSNNKRNNNHRPPVVNIKIGSKAAAAATSTSTSTSTARKQQSGGGKRARGTDGSDDDEKEKAAADGEAERDESTTEEDDDDYDDAAADEDMDHLGTNPPVAKFFLRYKKFYDFFFLRQMRDAANANKSKASSPPPGHNKKIAFRESCPKPPTTTPSSPSPESLNAATTTANSSSNSNNNDYKTFSCPYGGLDGIKISDQLYAAQLPAGAKPISAQMLPYSSSSSASSASSSASASSSVLLWVSVLYCVPAGTESGGSNSPQYFIALVKLLRRRTSNNNNIKQKNTTTTAADAEKEVEGDAECGESAAAATPPAEAEPQHLLLPRLHCVMALSENPVVSHCWLPMALNALDKQDGMMVPSTSLPPPFHMIDKLKVKTETLGFLSVLRHSMVQSALIIARTDVDHEEGVAGAPYTPRPIHGWTDVAQTDPWNAASIRWCTDGVSLYSTYAIVAFECGSIKIFYVDLSASSNGAGNSSGNAVILVARTKIPVRGQAGQTIPHSLPWYPEGALIAYGFKPYRSDQRSQLLHSNSLLLQSSSSPTTTGRSGKKSSGSGGGGGTGANNSSSSRNPTMLMYAAVCSQSRVTVLEDGGRQVKLVMDLDNPISAVQCTSRGVICAYGKGNIAFMGFHGELDLKDSGLHAVASGLQSIQCVTQNRKGGVVGNQSSSEMLLGTSAGGVLKFSRSQNNENNTSSQGGEDVVEGLLRVTEQQPQGMSSAASSTSTSTSATSKTSSSVTTTFIDTSYNLETPHPSHPQERNTVRYVYHPLLQQSDEQVISTLEGTARGDNERNWTFMYTTSGTLLFFVPH